MTGETEWSAELRRRLLRGNQSRQLDARSSSRAAARFRLKRSSAAGYPQCSASSERRERGLVGRTIVDDLQGRLGQPERLRRQRSIREVEQPDLKLERQVVERSQITAVRRLSYSPALHCAEFGDRIVRRDTDGGEHRLQGFAEPLNQGPSVSRWHHHRQQGPLADSKHDLSSASADQIGIPVAKDCFRWGRFRVRRDIEPVQQLLGTAKRKQRSQDGV